jgi:hypothetical protein
MWIRPIKALVLFAVLICCFAFFSCDEELPSYKPPENLLRTELGVSDNFINRFVYCGDGSKTWNLDPIIFKIIAINTFDETLQGPANFVSGKVEIWQREDPDFGRTIFISGAVDPRHVRNNVLTLDPGDTLEVGVAWYHEDDTGQRIWRKSALRPFNATIHARAQIKPFENVPVFFLPEIKLQVTYDVNVGIPVCNQ